MIYRLFIINQYCAFSVSGYDFMNVYINIL